MQAPSLGRNVPKKRRTKSKKLLSGPISRFVVNGELNFTVFSFVFRVFCVLLPLIWQKLVK